MVRKFFAVPVIVFHRPFLQIIVDNLHEALYNAVATIVDDNRINNIIVYVNGHQQS